MEGKGWTSQRGKSGGFAARCDCSWHRLRIPAVGAGGGNGDGADGMLLLAYSTSMLILRRSLWTRPRLKASAETHAHPAVGRVDRSTPLALLFFPQRRWGASQRRSKLKCSERKGKSRVGEKWKINANCRRRVVMPRHIKAGVGCRPKLLPSMRRCRVDVGKTGWRMVGAEGSVWGRRARWLGASRRWRGCAFLSMGCLSSSSS